MDSADLRNNYKQRKETFKKLLKKQKKNLTYISLLRLLVIVLATYFIVLGVKTGQVIFWPVVGLMLILFFTLVSYHKNQNDKRKLLQELIGLNQDELDCLDKKFASNPDGKQFILPDHPWSFDLDLFGHGSFFQFINRTSTHPGPQKLADYLNIPILEDKDIKTRQEIIRELAEKINLRQHFIANARLMDIEDDDFKEVIRWSEKPVFIEKYKWTRTLAWIMSLLTIAVVIAGIFSTDYFRLLLLIIIINLSILSPFVSRTNRYQVMVSKKHKFLKTYAVLLDILAKEKFEHTELHAITEYCKNGSKAIKKLTVILDLFDQRLNLLVGFVLNSLFLFDFLMLHRIAAWNKEFKDDFGKWLDICGQCDAQFSLAGFAYNHPDNNYPTINNEYQGLKAEDLGHPMIPENKRVDNSIEIKDERVVLITGANMAGKSTFLRSLGINMVLTYAGCPVTAKQFTTGNYLLYTSMRTSDSLKDDESYFFAEIKRLKVIVDQMKEGHKMFILLDEVLKGTNTTDKQKGSRGLIEKSIPHKVLCFIATHDLSLGKMEDEYKGNVINYCFESYIEDLELTFDYKIMPGLAKNMNASFLMKKMGIMD
ncbi:hypothetical protein ACFLRQ_01075 [Bacteroidota bacterium]